MTSLADAYARLPHAGGMRLLERVSAWDAHGIRCLTRSHQRPDNPLRAAAGLSSVHAIEYAAQAAAVHGVLCGVLTRGPVLLLAAAGDLDLARPYLDDLPGELCIEAALEARAGASARYRFVLASDEQRCASGTITLMPGPPAAAAAS